MIYTTLGLSTFIAQNPGLIAWILAGLLTFIASLISVYHGILLKRHGHNSAAIRALEKRMTTAELSIRGHAVEVKQARSEFRALGSRLESHMNEEREVWDELRDLGKGLARIEGELVSIKRAMPNGEMAEAIALLRRLVGPKG